MPRYRNISSSVVVVEGNLLQPNEEIELNYYIYNPNLQLIADDPVPAIVLASGEASLAAGNTQEVTWSNVLDDEELDITIIAESGDVEIYLNSLTATPIKLSSYEKFEDTVKTKYVYKLILKATTDAVVKYVVAKKVRA